MERNKRQVSVILGPTSSGKTSIAIEICKKIGSQVLSADSRQIYKKMDIGTGKIPINSKMKVIKNKDHWTFDEVKIFGYDLVSPDEYFSSYDYAQYALSKLSELNNTILVGGTGFYIDMVTGRITPARVKPDFDLRKKLKNKDVEELQRILKKENPIEYEKIDKNNPARLIRAIEKAKSTTKKEIKLQYLENTEFKLIGFTAPRDYLYGKADKWVEEIWEKGLIEEVVNLMNSDYKNSTKLKGIVYKEAVVYISGGMSQKEAIEKTKYSIHSYIRRQQTYFKKMPKITWIDVSEDNILEKVYNIING